MKHALRQGNAGSFHSASVVEAGVVKAAGCTKVGVGRPMPAHDVVSLFPAICVGDEMDSQSIGLEVYCAAGVAPQGRSCLQSPSPRFDGE